MVSKIWSNMVSCFYCIFEQINAALVRISDVFQKCNYFQKLKTVKVFTVKVITNYVL